MTADTHAESVPLRRARVGFLGVGWIGRHRMEHMLATGLIEAVALADPSDAMIADAQHLVPAAKRVDDLGALLQCDLGGIAIATPSALHAQQTVTALERGVAVFCQKPLGRNAEECRQAIDAARHTDRLLGVDLSYRLTEGVQHIKRLIDAGELGRIHFIDLTFHNAYGPDKAWFYDRDRSGGGCLMDLGVHLIDLALWLSQPARVAHITSHLFAAGERLRGNQVEDLALATLTLDSGCVVRIACSWRSSAGQDALIGVEAHGTSGGAAMRNAGGSFYDFVTERFKGTSRELLATYPEAWGGRMAADWATKLARGVRFEPEVASIVETAEVIDRIYGGHS